MYFLRPLPPAVQSPLDALGEGEIGDRLEHIVQRPHRVPLHGELRHVGEEDDDHLVVHLADGLGGAHAVHIGHGDIHKDDVVAGSIALGDLRPVGKGGDSKMLPALLGKTLQILCQLPAVVGVILHQRDPDHKQALPLRARHGEIWLPGIVYQTNRQIGIVSVIFSNAEKPQYK